MYIPTCLVLVDAILACFALLDDLLACLLACLLTCLPACLFGWFVVWLVGLTLDCLAMGCLGCSLLAWLAAWDDWPGLLPGWFAYIYIYISGLRACLLCLVAWLPSFLGMLAWTTCLPGLPALLGALASVLPGSSLANLACSACRLLCVPLALPRLLPLRAKLALA